METRAPYQTEAPKGPRNLAAVVAAWLRTQGFTATEQLLPPNYAAVSAYWTGYDGEHFVLDYTWVAGPVPEASCQLRVRNRSFFEPLFTAQRVRRLKDVRQLLTGCVRYHNARLLARPAAPVIS